MICWINPFSGLAGDMLLAALIDAGAPVDRIREAIGSTGLTGWELSAERVTTHGLAAVRVRVEVSDTATERPAGRLVDMVSRVRPRPVSVLAAAALTAISEVEGRLHGVDPHEVHLHELGGHDAVVDIVGIAAALHHLGVTEVVCGPLPLGVGRTRSAHGIIPVPAPATLELLRGAVVTGTDIPGETVTPTAAAVLSAVAARYEPLPPAVLGRTGYGAGTRTLGDRPNVCAVTVAEGVPAGRESVALLETNLDDVTGETLAHVVHRVLEAGALDAWVTPAVMKKGRPAHVLHCLCHPGLADSVQELMSAETGTLGIRRSDISRSVLPRHTEVVDVRGAAVRVKHGPYRVKAEHDDVAAAAARLGLSLREVAELAAAAAAREEDGS
ncbi:nickel pincer cofactor biosynthesis protein LarC [Streptomyces cocklensis]|uniref:Pyridinium-3,5-bisthiocarboxylic acid mononucleotide nickel insertion protein n=1 Tax=Actinacidiphila cocklensis TaxID=887465 RepID=A0A9W4DXY2_9ACTN|nr:nickel pincer cofactor biosynthesis protein LarC [Actinacidiphila cocklensis]MDD1059953.1 nickel pincer cofactor biosynthesis protein LarC [Actinacidiphila cocklensis]CAG6395912.1 Putative nickel insertion protein [Actinacidiphila cocklensis]